MLNGKVMIIRLIVGQIKKRKVKVQLDLSNYATKTDLKNATGIDTPSFAKKVDLTSLKSNVDKLKLKNIN